MTSLFISAVSGVFLGRIRTVGNVGSATVGGTVGFGFLVVVVVPLGGPNMSRSRSGGGVNIELMTSFNSGFCECTPAKQKMAKRSAWINPSIAFIS